AASQADFLDARLRGTVALGEDPFGLKRSPPARAGEERGQCSRLFSHEIGDLNERSEQTVVEEHDTRAARELARAFAPTPDDPHGDSVATPRREHLRAFSASPPVDQKR